MESRPLDEIRAIEDTSATPVVRTYLPTEPATGQVEMAVIQAAREWHACAAYGIPSQRLALESPGYIRGPYSGNFGRQTTEPTLSKHSHVTQLSETVLDPDWRTYVIESESAQGLYLQIQRSIVQPGHVHVLPDGRVGVVLTELVPEGGITERESMPDHTVQFQIYVQDPDQGNRWVLDESLSLCPGGCEPITDTPATPAATPLATPADRAARWGRFV